MRLLVLATAVLTFLFLGLQSLSFQVQTTAADANLTVQNTHDALNATNGTATTIMTTIGHGMPLILAGAVVVFVAVLLWAVGR